VNYAQMLYSFCRGRNAAPISFGMKPKNLIGRAALSANRDTNRRVGCAKLREPINHSGISSGEELWLTKRSARIHRAHARHKKAESIAALRVKAPVTQSNWIAIAVTQSVREISENGILQEKAQETQKESCLEFKPWLLCRQRFEV